MASRCPEEVLPEEALLRDPAFPELARPPPRLPLEMFLEPEARLVLPREKFPPPDREKLLLPPREKLPPPPREPPPPPPREKLPPPPRPPPPPPRPPPPPPRPRPIKSGEARKAAMVVATIRIRIVIFIAVLRVFYGVLTRWISTLAILG
ncbi:MAG: hypothetical protein C5B58_15365 [Acidobacteria bacterium]|nr:MAG: hypothetical protein C5B58_15365 [Acidobacteriota bacterium]